MPARSVATPNSGARELSAVLRRARGALKGVALFSCLINLLMLAGPLFMLQVYDRVLPSRSVPTLIALVVLVVGLYAIQGALELIRGRILLRIGLSLEESLSARVFDIITRLPLKVRGTGDGLQAIRDLDQIRSFLSSGGPGAFFDLPWIPLYIGLCFLFHFWIGIAATLGACILVFLTAATELSTRGPTQAASRFVAERNSVLAASRRNAEVLRAMGMASALLSRFSSLSQEYASTQRSGGDRSSGLGSFSRVTRMVLQSLVLALGAFLVINQEATPGIIIASSILVARALAPVDLVIANWKGFVASRQAHKRLVQMLDLVPLQTSSLILPPPTKSLRVEGLSAAPPGEQRVVLQDISFALEAGSSVGIIGPSASGKSTLARLLVGVWSPMRGKIRLDAAALEQWSADQLGRHIGYLPQDVELFEGTVADNICRFASQPDPKLIIAATQAAAVHDLILHLSDGYQTRIGESGTALSAGQRQRIALARALYGDPFLVVLDEPNSNLDSDGESALTLAIESIRARGGIAVVIAHRPSALAAVDQVLVLNQGKQQALGSRDEILRKVLKTPSALPMRVVGS